jgi:hypothetical protein
MKEALQVICTTLAMAKGTTSIEPAGRAEKAQHVGIDMNDTTTILSFARGLATWLSDQWIDINSL